VIDVRTWHRSRRFPREHAARLLRATARGERKRLGAVTVLFVGDRAMKDLNRRHLRHDWTTDVLSFSYGEGRTLEGEIVVNLDQARRQAPMFGATYRQEVSRLIVHGLLHLAGHDDRTIAQRNAMHRREDRYLPHTRGVHRPETRRGPSAKVVAPGSPAVKKSRRRINIHVNKV
jgi:rRNA maturation RNase YbeY